MRATNLRGLGGFLKDVFFTEPREARTSMIGVGAMMVYKQLRAARERAEVFRSPHTPVPFEEWRTALIERRLALTAAEAERIIGALIRTGRVRPASGGYLYGGEREPEETKR